MGPFGSCHASEKLYSLRPAKTLHHVPQPSGSSLLSGAALSGDPQRQGEEKRHGEEIRGSMRAGGERERERKGRDQSLQGSRRRRCFLG